MMSRKMMRGMKCQGILSLFLMLTVMLTEAQGNDLTVSVGHIPGHAEEGPDGKPQGGFIDLITAMDAIYEEGAILILGIFPFDQSFINLKEGAADFHLPLVKVDEHAVDALVFSSEQLAHLSEVLYTNADKPELDIDQLDQYTIEVTQGHGEQYPFNVNEVADLESGLLNVANGRSDGFLIEQDAADAYIRAHHMKNIRRQLFRQRPVHIMFARTPNVDELDQRVTIIIQKLRENGRLQAIMDTVHTPYEDWQPSQMSW